MAATFPKMRKWDKNGESWQQGSEGITVSVEITQLSWAGAEIGSRCSRLCDVHPAARVTEWPVGGTHNGLGRKGLADDIGNRQIWEADVV